METLGCLERMVTWSWKAGALMLCILAAGPMPAADVEPAPATPAQAQAHYFLGRCYFEGLGVKQDFALARLWFETAATGGSADAHYALAAMHRHGTGVPRDLGEAVKWLRQAATAGHAGARGDLWVLHRAGLVAPKDPEELVQWWHQAAAEGQMARVAQAARRDATDEWFRMGVRYRQGEGVRRDPAVAVKWFLRAAEHGHTESQFELALLYALGLGVERNPAEAWKWVRLAGKSRNLPEDQVALVVQRAATAADRAEGERRIELFLAERNLAGSSPANTLADRKTIR